MFLDQETVSYSKDNFDSMPADEGYASHIMKSNTYFTYATIMN
jgi:hypothetical protein